MIKFKINGSDIQVPSDWTDLTFAQYLRILKPGNDTTEMISILTGLDRETLLNSKIIGLESLMEVSNFMTKQPVFDLYYSQVGPHKMPPNRTDPKTKERHFDIRIESLGQFEDMRAVMRSVEGDLIKHTIAYGRYVAIYLQKIIDGAYKPDRVSEVEAEVQSYRACEIIALGQFFFLKLLLLLNGTAKTSLPTNQSPKKSKSDLKTSKRNSVPMRRLTGSRGK